MPRDITKTVYTFDELTDEAKDRAVELVREKLAGSWWDSSDTTDIANVIVMSFAEEIGTPGADVFGVADFPGIDGITLDAWNLETGLVLFNGVLTREAGPKLPWGETALASVEMRGASHYRTMNGFYAEGGEKPSEDGQHLFRAIDEAAKTALRTGQDEAEYKTSEAAAREWCEGNEVQEYEEDGTLV